MVQTVMYCQDVSEGHAETTYSSLISSFWAQLLQPKMWWGSEGRSPRDCNQASRLFYISSGTRHSKLIGQELNRKQRDERMRIINNRIRDTKLFHQLVNQQRNKGLNFIENLQVGDDHYAGRDQILQGFKQHFETKGQ